MKVKVSAPGKVHLIGEHAVVYGHPAIIAAVGRRIYLEAEKSDSVEMIDKRFNKHIKWTLDECREAAEHAKKLLLHGAEKGNYSEIVAWTKDGGTYNNYWKAMFGIVLGMVHADSGLRVNVTKCDIPTGSGLGSSSAASVALAKAASEVYERGFSVEKINEIAFECERLVHGTPSGGDNTACAYGGLIWFQKAQPKNTINPISLPHKLENFVLAYTKQPEKSTGEIVQMVRNIPQDIRDPKMQEIDKMTHEMKDVLNRKDYERMKEIINKTNEILSSFGLSVEETDLIAERIRLMGGAAKMCGACYGGVMLTWHKHPERVVEAIKELGFEPIQTDLAVEGVRIED